jgi:ureidoacrylate peracid hydrolase
MDKMNTHFSNLPEGIAPKHTALIVVDVQNDFCSPKGECARRGRDISMMLDMASRLADLIQAARESNVLVIFLRGVEGVDHVLSDAWAELVSRHTKPSELELCREGTEGADFFPPVIPTEGDVVITKYRYSAFVGTNLDQVLRSKNILTVVVTGVVTDVCVEATARNACDLDYRVVIVDDCTATWSQEIQNSALERMGQICAQRATADEIIHIWNATWFAK